MSKFLTISPFRLIGQLENFVMKDGVKTKYLRIRVTSREFWVEIPEKLGAYLDTKLSPKAWLEVEGTRETKSRMGIFKLKAETIKILTQPQEPYVVIMQEKVSKKRILVCKQTECWERGGKTLCQQIKTKLVDNGLENQVEIRLTGCLKQCKKGPNVVILPDKIQYNQVSIRQVDNLLKKHFT
ncbi:(Fe-S)-binding protein [cyanobacterium endosymbiont of Rhopalodia gibberula]|uniref:(2Fe-2S) ferredoxin domain-containing protein n=1 Tax=cyanobacterium endosymbiont of Rhopalodia gibberula TaxID=1763363 RepID=UPI000DC6E310|nr:(2Fe-2S) ferredoxin domain-containing protein [cyanobacterium endosymbiont of Rhopalodia gibberula]BBA78673.1 (Fe-S)-binding protein [cyanobacterium endosymbiont of Rhopalodia gibberula]